MKSKSARVNGDSKRALTSMQQVSRFRIVYSRISVLWIIQMLSAKNWRRDPFLVFTGYTGYKQNHLVPVSYHFVFQIMFCWIRKAHLHCLHWTYTHSLPVKSSSIVVGREKLLTGVTNDFFFSVRSVIVWDTCRPNFAWHFSGMRVFEVWHSPFSGVGL